MTEQEVQTHIIPKSRAIINEVKKAVIGKDDIIIKILLAVAAKGHILLDDIPGVGKTTLAVAFSKAMSLDYKRMQFTPDVMPADVTGFNVYNKQTGQFEYKEGAAICSLFLADEIRPAKIKVRYIDENFEEVEREFNNFGCRIVQHEMDHLKGILFTDKVSQIRKKLIAGKLNNIANGKVRTNYKIVRKPKR